MNDCNKFTTILCGKQLKWKKPEPKPTEGKKILWLSMKRRRNRNPNHYLPSNRLKKADGSGKGEGLIQKGSAKKEEEAQHPSS